MNILRLGIFVIVAIALASFASAYYAVVPDTWNSNQVYAGSFYLPNSSYSGWTYNSFYPNSGYPTIGGGTYIPPGYFRGYSYGFSPYANYYGYPNYYTYGYAYGDYYGRCTSYYC